MVHGAYRKSPYPVVFYERYYSLYSLPTRKWQRVTILAAHIAKATLQVDKNKNTRYVSLYNNNNDNEFY